MTSLALAESRLRQFLALAKPRVVSLIVFCAVIGMFLATPGLPNATAVFAATIGIALVAGAAAAINCLVERKIDAVMQRTRARPLRVWRSAVSASGSPRPSSRHLDYLLSSGWLCSWSGNEGGRRRSCRAR